MLTFEGPTTQDGMNWLKLLSVLAGCVGDPLKTQELVER